MTAVLEKEISGPRDRLTQRQGYVESHREHATGGLE